MRIGFCFPRWRRILAGMLALAGWAGATSAEEKPGRLLGTFRVTFYFVSEERGTGDWPLFSPACAEVLALASREFHHSLSLEGTGRLADGRMLNFSGDCPCARPGHLGRRICYELVDQGRYPWGLGARIGYSHVPLEPFRTVAVDPGVIPVGSVLFVPAWRGGRWPDGSARDGCFRAEDSGSGIRGRHVDLFSGKPEWAERLQGEGLKQVRVYAHSPLCRHLKSS